MTEPAPAAGGFAGHRICIAPMMDWTDFIDKTAAQVHREAHRIKAEELELLSFRARLPFGSHAAKVPQQRGNSKHGLHCHWRDSQYIRDASTPVLLYWTSLLRSARKSG